MFSRRLIGALACLPFVPGCATQQGRSPFPSRAEVEALTQGSGAANPFEQAVVDADTWAFSEPLIETLAYEPYVDPSPWGKLLEEYAAHDPGRLTPTRSMHCAARELARFYLEYAAMPAVPLRRAIVEHCGSLALDALPQFVFGAAAAEHDDETLHHTWQATVRAALRQGDAAGPRDLGIAFARDEKKAVVVMLSGARRVQLEPVSRVVDGGGTLLLRGRALVPADRISALVNRGRYGYAACTPAGNTRPPEFAFACAIDAADHGARIDLAAYREGRIFGDGLVGVEALRDTAQSVYKRHRYVDEMIVSDQSQLPSRLLDLVNEVRRRTELEPVVLSEAESATSEKLAPKYFEAASDPAKEMVAEVIVVGLLAGWDVGAPIRDAGFTSAAVGPTRDASEWLSAVLSSPGGRAALLEPDSRVVAFGPVMVDSPAVIGALFTSYTLFDSADHAAVRERVIEKIRAARSAEGMSAPVIITTLDDDASALAAEIQAGEATPPQALAGLIQQSSTVLGRSVRGLVYESVDVDQLVVPPELLSAKRLELSVTVTHYQPAGEPWGRYVVLLVIPGEGPQA
jgi:hypothetical protein